MSDLTLYVVAGPNGIGKTTSTYDLIPAGIPIINLRLCWCSNFYNLTYSKL